MFGFFRHLRTKWADWCGDAEMERAIRRHLSDQGYFGGSAKLRAVRLAAVKRPGWLQIYRFDARVRRAVVAPPGSGDTEFSPSLGGDPAAGGVYHESGAYHELFGLVREDHRHSQTSVRVFASADGRRELFSRWSEGLVQLRSGRALTGD
jgi:hypothetical protein